MQYITIAQGECMRRAEFGLQANKIAEELQIGPDFVTGHRGLYFATIMCHPKTVIAGQQYPGAVKVTVGGPHRNESDNTIENELADALLAYVLSPGY